MVLSSYDSCNDEFVRSRIEEEQSLTCMLDPLATEVMSRSSVAACWKTVIEIAPVRLVNAESGAALSVKVAVPALAE
jgi:hypothetical protein